MMRRLYENITLFIAVFVLALITTAATTHAQGGAISEGVCRGILTTEGGSVSKDDDAGISACMESGNESFTQLVRSIINVFSIVVGAVSVIMIIVGGFRYIISGGDSSGVSAAKNTILYAIVGLVIVLFAQVIIRFVYSSVTRNAPSTTRQQPSSSLLRSPIA